MKCPKCGFENMSGLSRCFRCDSIITLESKHPIDINPPRMSKWEKPLRYFARIVRTCMPGISNKTTESIQSFSGMLGGDPAIGIILSFFPGLAHILQRRFKEIRYYVLAWFVLLFPVAFFWSTTIGAIIFGILLSIHGWIGIHAGVIREFSSIRKRLIYLSVAMFFYWLAFYYVFCGQFLLRSVAISGVTRTIASQNIEQGDLLLGNRLFAASNIERGDFVLTYVSGLVQHGQRITPTRRNGMIYSQVVALPGETIEIKNGSFYVNGEELDQERYPEARWLKEQNTKINLSKNQYFVQYATHGRGPDEVLTEFVHPLFVRNADDLHAKAFMVWRPLSKRSFLRD